MLLDSTSRPGQASQNAIRPGASTYSIFSRKTAKSWILHVPDLQVAFFVMRGPLPLPRKPCSSYHRLGALT